MPFDHRDQCPGRALEPPLDEQRPATLTRRPVLPFIPCPSVCTFRVAKVRAKLSRFEGVVDFVMIYAPTFLLEPDVVRAEHEAMIVAFASS